MSWTKRKIELMQEGYSEEEARLRVKSERERVEELEYTKSKTPKTPKKDGKKQN